MSSENAGRVLTGGGSIDDRVERLRKMYAWMWREESDWLWWRAFLEEFIELTLSLLGLHKDPPNLELLQLSAIAANWIEVREGRAPLPKEETIEEEE